MFSYRTILCFHIKSSVLQHVGILSICPKHSRMRERKANHRGVGAHRARYSRRRFFIGTHRWVYVARSFFCTQRRRGFGVTHLRCRGGGLGNQRPYGLRRNGEPRPFPFHPTIAKRCSVLSRCAGWKIRYIRAIRCSTNPCGVVVIARRFLGVHAETQRVWSYASSMLRGGLG